MRVAVAGLLGAIAMFVWASIAHGLTPPAAIGIGQIPNETSAIAALGHSLGDTAGVYVFPSSGQTGLPRGLLVYSPPGGPSGVTPRQLAVEFVLELIESMLAAVIIAGASTGGFAGRVGVAVAIGAIAAMATNFSYWNWYGFGLRYTLATSFVELLKFVFAGAVIALVLARRPPAAA